MTPTRPVNTQITTLFNDVPRRTQNAGILESNVTNQRSRSQLVSGNRGLTPNAESTMMWQSRMGGGKKCFFIQKNFIDFFFLKFFFIVLDMDRETFQSNIVFNKHKADLMQRASNLNRRMNNIHMGKKEEEMKHSRLVDRDKKLGRKTVQHYREKREKEMRQFTDKYYVQRVDDIGYLRHTMGPDKKKTDPDKNQNKEDKWRKILLWEFLGCTFR